MLDLFIVLMPVYLVSEVPHEVPGHMSQVMDLAAVQQDDVRVRQGISRLVAKSVLPPPARQNTIISG